MREKQHTIRSAPKPTATPSSAVKPSTAMATATTCKPTPTRGAKSARISTINTRTTPAMVSVTARGAARTASAKPTQPRTRATKKPTDAVAAELEESEMLTSRETAPRVDGVKSEPRRGGGGASDEALGEPPSARPLRRTVSNITTDTEEVRRLRAQLQSMKEQVVFLHRTMQKLASQQLPAKHPRASESPRQRLSFSGFSPVKKTRDSFDVLVMPEDDKNPFQDQWTQKPPPTHVDPSSRTTASTHQLASQLDACQRENDTLTLQLQQQTQEMELEKAEYEAQLEDYATKLTVIDNENLELHAHVQEYEEENLRLHAALAELANEQDRTMTSNNQGETTGAEEDLDELGIDGLGAEPEAIHERCDVKIHELWQTIKTLKAYVETFRVENEDLRVQRDQAIASAERAWQENSKLAGNNNPQQKIKYVETLKHENAELTQQVRELQSKLTKKQFKWNDHGPRKDGRGSSAGSASEPLDEYPSMDSADDHSDDGSYEERTKLLKKMWARNKKLEDEIVRLQKEKQALVTRQPRSPPSSDSKQSKQSKQSSTTRSTTRSSTPPSTSSRWKK